MGNKLTLVCDPDLGYEWIYINDNLVATGQPIDSEQWLNLIQRNTVHQTKKLELSAAFDERVDCDYNAIPKQLSGFLDGDLI